MPSSITKGDSYAILESYTASGPSGGSASCNSSINGTITDTSSLSTGTHTITCTAKTGAGKTVSVSKTINITYTAYTVTNLITNGSFEDGIDEWYNRSSEIDYSKYTYTSLYNVPRKYGDSMFRIVALNGDQVFARANYFSNENLANHKIYAKVSTLREGTKVNPGLYYVSSSTAEDWPPVTSTSTYPVWYESVSSVDQYQWVDLTLYETVPYNYFSIMLAQSSDSSDVVGVPFFFDGLIVVDLTETFGAGNEPDKEWCDSHISYFDGTTTIYK